MTPVDDTRPFPNLSTPRLALRSLCAEDAPELHRIWTDPAVTEHLVLEPFTSLEETEGMMRILTDLWGFRHGDPMGAGAPGPGAGDLRVPQPEGGTPEGGSWATR